MKQATEKAANQCDASTPPDGLPLDLYKEICQNIRVTDDISFKLLGFVPLAAGIGTGALMLLEKGGLLIDHLWLTVILLSALGAVATLGLFLWELRNIQKCDWLIARAGALEQHLLVRFPPLTTIQFAEWPPGKKFRKKTFAEGVIYIAAIIAWLVPAVIALLKHYKGVL